MSSETVGSNIGVIIKKLSFSATVYHIWLERNSRIFNDCKKSEDTLFSLICDDIRAKLMSIKVKLNVNVLKAESEWEVKFERKG